MKNHKSIENFRLEYFLTLLYALFISPLFLWWLWNITMTPLFHLPEIGYWEAFRINILFGILFLDSMKSTYSSFITQRVDDIYQHLQRYK